MIKALSHVAVLVSDIDKSIDFYCNVLGLKEKFRLNRENGDVHLVYLEVAPGQFIELFPGAESAHERLKMSGAVHICLQVEDIQAAYSEFTARGLVPHGEPQRGLDKSWQFWTSDPDSNPIEFHQFTSESMQTAGNPQP